MFGRLARNGRHTVEQNVALAFVVKVENVLGRRDGPVYCMEARPEMLELKTHDLTLKISALLLRND